MKKTVIIVILILCLGGATAWLIKGQTLSDTKSDKQETLVQESGKQETDKQETDKQEMIAQKADKQETDGQEADVQEADKREADEEKTNEQISYNTLERDQLLMNKPIGKIEYPMSDLHFDKNKKYRVTLKDQTTGKVIKEYVDQGEFFKSNKKEFSIITASSEKRDAAPYLLSIYEGKKCIKEIAYMALQNDMIGDNWVTIN